MKRKEEGITLIALVITIIILLILAGVSISWITSGNSIFDHTKVAVQETKRAEIIEYLDLTLTDEQISGYKETVETVITKTHDRVQANGKNDLNDIAKEVEVMNLETKQINENEQEYYFFVVADGDIYRVGANGAKYIGRKSNEQVELKEGEIKFVYSDTNLTNQDVIVTINTTNQLEGAKIVYRINYNGTEEKGAWQDYNTKEKITVNKNCSIDAKIIGITGETTTATGNVQNIDKLAPKKITQENSKTTNSITITVQAEDQEATNDYSKGKIVGYSFSKDGIEWSNYQASGKYTFEKLTQSTPYTIQIKAKDEAGNETETPVEVQVTTDEMIGYVAAGEGQVANITFNELPTDWTNEDVIVTASTTTKYEIETSTDKENWVKKASQTLSKNGDVYARLIDSTGQFAEGSYATATVTKIDKEAPNVPNITLNIANDNANYESGTWINKDVKVSFTTTDNGESNIKCYQYANNENGNNAQEKTSPFTVNAEGITNIYIRAIDNAGNPSNWSEVKIIKVDKTPPEVTLNGTENGTTDVRLTGTVTDRTSNVYYQWSTSETAPSNGWTSIGGKTTTQTRNVTSSEYFWVKDEAGNTTKKYGNVYRSI